MTIDEFVKTKPNELRLGQWFFNQYLFRLKPDDRQHHEKQWLYNVTNDVRAEMYIRGMMLAYNWKELPNV